jgi:hypothetical protein
MNVIFEHFRDADVDILNGNDFRFGLVATEIPIGQSFNGIDQEPWLTRRRAFNKIAPRAEFIWSFAEAPVEAYARWAPSGYLELGYLENIDDPIFASEPEFDFGFYGTLQMSSYRSEVLERLRKYFTVVTPNDFLIGSELNRFIASFKIGICLKHTPNWLIPSPGRVGRLLHAKRGIAAEFVPMPTRASALSPMAEKDQDFAEFCLECLDAPWKQRADDAYERFRATMPMTEIMERLLDETVAKRAVSIRSKKLAYEDDGDRVDIGIDEPAQLLHSERGYNFVRYANRVYGVAQAIGHIDFSRDATGLVQRFGPRAVVVAQTVAEARARVAALSEIYTTAS